MRPTLIEDPRGPRAARPTPEELAARECPFGVAVVPNLDAHGRQDPKYPFAISRAACGPACALYDEAAKRPGCVTPAAREPAPLPASAAARLYEGAIKDLIEYGRLCDQASLSQEDVAKYRGVRERLGRAGLIG